MLYKYPKNGIGRNNFRFDKKLCSVHIHESKTDKINSTKDRVEDVLEKWILTHDFYTREKAYIKDANGNDISLNQVLEEIRNETEFGKKVVDNILSIAISLLQKDINNQKL